MLNALHMVRLIRLKGIKTLSRSCHAWREGGICWNANDCVRNAVFERRFYVPICSSENCESTKMLSKETWAQYSSFSCGRALLLNGSTECHGFVLFILLRRVYYAIYDL